MFFFLWGATFRYHSWLGLFVFISWLGLSQFAGLLVAYYFSLFFPYFWEGGSSVMLRIRLDQMNKLSEQLLVIVI